MSGRKELALFVFIDALGWEVFSRHAFLQELWATASPMETVLGYSCTCDPTILTGCMPHEHGHFSFFLKDRSERSPLRHLRWLNLLPSKLVDRGRVRRLLSRAVASQYRFDGYFQLYETPFDVLPYFDYSEKRDIYQPGGILGGQPTIFDSLRARNIPFSLSDWRRSEPENLRQLSGEVEQGEIQFAYLYLAGLDGILHAEGTQSSRASQHLAWYETEIRKILLKSSATYDNVRVYLFSDHGMTDVRQHLDLQNMLRRLPLTFGKDYVAYFDSTMARFWFQNPNAESQIRGLLAGVNDGRVLDDAELRQFGVLFDDRRYGELIFLCDPGVLLCPSFMGKRPLAGMHGYDPRDRHSTATFAASEQGGPTPARLDQMFALMEWEADRLTGHPRHPSDSSDSIDYQPSHGAMLAGVRS